MLKLLLITKQNVCEILGYAKKFFYYLYKRIMKKEGMYCFILIINTDNTDVLQSVCL